MKKNAKPVANPPRKKSPNFPAENSALLELAWERYDSGAIEDSLACFEELLVRELGEKVFTGFAFDELVRIYRQNDDFPRLVDVCERACCVFAEDPHLIQTLSEAYLAAGAYESAVKTSQRLLAMDTENISYLRLLLKALLARGDWDGAENFFQKAAFLEREDKASLFFLFSQKLLEHGCYERAEQALQECIKLSNHVPLYLCALGDCLLKQQKLTAALAVYDSVLATVKEENAAGYCNRFASSLKNEGFGECAASYLEQAVVLAGNEKRYILALAEVYCALGKTEKSHKLLS